MPESSRHQEKTFDSFICYRCQSHHSIDQKSLALFSVTNDKKKLLTLLAVTDVSVITTLKELCLTLLHVTDDSIIAPSRERDWPYWIQDHPSEE
jgi:hypothetical protein